MKYLTFCLLLLAAIICLSIFGASHVTVHVSDTEQLLQEAMNCYTNDRISDAQQALEQAKESWAACENSFGILLHHEEFVNVQSDLATLRIYQAPENQTDFCGLCASLISKLQHIREMEWPYLFNIL